MEEKNSGGKDDRYSLQIYAALPLGGVGSPRAAALLGWQALALSRRGPPRGQDGIDGRPRLSVAWRRASSRALTATRTTPAVPFPSLSASHMTGGVDSSASRFSPRPCRVPCAAPRLDGRPWTVDTGLDGSTHTHMLASGCERPPT